jgi:hypothetical protein
LPLNVPAPDPLTVMLLAHVAVNVTAALVVVVGVTVYLTLPQPLAGVDAVEEDQVPANASIDVDPDGLVGDVVVSESLSFLPVRFERTSQPAVRTQASSSAVLTLDFMILLIVTYDPVLYGV